MKKEVVFEKIRLLLAPVLVIVLGLVLLFHPDSASILISRILGWSFGLVAIGFGIAAIVSPQGRFGKVAGAVVFALVGGWLGSNPLLLAAWIGRFIGIFLVIDGVQDILHSRSQGTSFLFPLVVALVGVVLVLLPMTASRLLFSVCGAVVVIVGVVMLLERLRGRKRLNGGEDPNIIDAL